MLVTEQVAGVPLSSAHPAAAEAAGAVLRHVHTLNASPPFPSGASTWSQHVRNWAEREITCAGARGTLTSAGADRLWHDVAACSPLLDRRPIVLIHGDCQPDHILIDPAARRVAALLDFVDAGPGDPLLDLAVLTLWDEALTARLFAGYGLDVGEADVLLPLYRVLRHLSASRWLVAHDLPAAAQRHDGEVLRLLQARGDALPAG